MCAGSGAKIKGKGVSLYMGYYGGSLEIDGIMCIRQEQEDSPYKDTSKEALDFLMSCEKEELVQLIYDLVMNSSEA